jgi:hypothetical protein
MDKKNGVHTQWKIKTKPSFEEKDVTEKDVKQN